VPQGFFLQVMQQPAFSVQLVPLCIGVVMQAALYKWPSLGCAACELCQCVVCAPYMCVRALINDSRQGGGC